MRVLVMGAMAAIVLTAGLAGCGDDDNPVVVKKPFSMYSDASTPEEVIADLQLAYRRREIEPYAALLSADFQFHFLEADAQGLPIYFYARDEDSTSTGCLFSGEGFGLPGTEVTDIRIELSLTPSDTAALERFPGEMLRTIEADVAVLDVDLSTGPTFRIIGDHQEFHFRQGQGARGENPDRWYIVDWRDLGSLGSRNASPTVELPSWGGIKRGACPR